MMNTSRILIIPAVLLLVTYLILTGMRHGLISINTVVAQESDMSTLTDSNATTKVYVFNSQGDLVGPIEEPKVVKTDAQWKAELTPKQYEILRHADTEAPYCGTLLDNKKQGVYICAGCGLPLYSSDAKYTSGTGWPSFFKPISPDNIVEVHDDSHGMQRTELLCARCGGHLGHVFDDGPQPTGKRHCLNSESLKFVPSDQLATLADPFAYQPPTTDGLATAVFAGGCFWCTEAVFEPIEGVISVVSGYAGGSADTAHYDQVSTGNTNHAESIQITYDPTKVSYTKLLELFFNIAHDPTQLNHQGNDVGRQYRSVVFYADEAQKDATMAYIKHLQDSGQFTRPIVTTLEPLTGFYPAETYHQNYVAHNPKQPYVQAVAKPKVEKLEEHYSDMLKDYKNAPAATQQP